MTIGKFSQAKAREEESLRINRPLKLAGSKAIEEAISKALSELTGHEYKADILSVDFEPSESAAESDTVLIKFSTKRTPISSIVPFEESERA